MWRNKYNAKKTEYRGVMYDSKREAEYAAELDLRVRAKDIKSWRRQVKISIDINGEHICNYLCDFEITHNDGSKELVEVKGMQTDVYKIKLKLLRATLLKKNPKLKYTIAK